MEKVELQITEKDAQKLRRIIGLKTKVSATATVKSLINFEDSWQERLITATHEIPGPQEKAKVDAAINYYYSGATYKTKTS